MNIKILFICCLLGIYTLQNAMDDTSQENKQVAVLGAGVAENDNWGTFGSDSDEFDDSEFVEAFAVEDESTIHNSFVKNNDEGSSTPSTQHDAVLAASLQREEEAYRQSSDIAVVKEQLSEIQRGLATINLQRDDSCWGPCTSTAFLGVGILSVFTNLMVLSHLSYLSQCS